MTEVFFLVVALVIGTPAGPDGAVRAIQAPSLQACEEQAKKINELVQEDKNTAARAKCVTMIFPSELFKKGISV